MNKLRKKTKSSEKRNDMPKRKKVAVLGAPSVGKSSLIYQFIFCHFEPCLPSSKQPKVYFPNVLVNHNLYEMAILDPPYSKDDDTFNMHEWAQSQFSCVSGQSADAFILVYDVSVPLTFKYIQVLREQINESFEGASEHVPILVVGNKCDINKRAYPLHVVTELVKKHWHCEYMECSAKFNWHVFAVFREIMHLVDSAASANGASLHGGLVNCLHHSLPQHWHLSNHHFNFHRRRRSRTFSRATLYSNTRSRSGSARRISLKTFVSNRHSSPPQFNRNSFTTSRYSRLRSYITSCLTHTETT